MPLKRTAGLTGIDQASNHKWRHGTNATILTIAVVSIVVLLNVVAGQHQLRFDVTRNKEYSLSEQTKAVLADLSDPVKLTAFLVDGESQLTRDLIHEYELASPRIEVEIIDPIKHPDRARAYDLSSAGAVIFESGNRSEKLESSDLFDYGSISYSDPYQMPDFIGEQAFTSAVLKVTRGTTDKAYFVSGHVELSITNELSQIAEALRREGYEVEELPLAIKGTVPDDASLVVVAGPKRDLTTVEVDAINEYLNRGGRLMALIDPPIDLDSPLSNLVSLLKQWGVDLQGDVVIDPEKFMIPEVAWAVPNLDYHTITRPLRTAGLPVVLPYARSLNLLQDAGDHLDITTLLTTSNKAWGETALHASSVPAADGDDPRGPLTLGVAITADVDDTDGAEDTQGDTQDAESNEDTPTMSGEARLVVVGDSTFATNSYLQLGNPDLFLNAANWLTGMDTLVSIRPKSLDLEPLYVTGAQFSMMFYGTTLVIPAIVLMAGIGVYLRRRNL